MKNLAPQIFSVIALMTCTSTFAMAFDEVTTKAIKVSGNDGDSNPPISDCSYFARQVTRIDGEKIMIGLNSASGHSANFAVYLPSGSLLDEGVRGIDYRKSYYLYKDGVLVVTRTRNNTQDFGFSFGTQVVYKMQLWVSPDLTKVTQAQFDMTEANLSQRLVGASTLVSSMKCEF